MIKALIDTCKSPKTWGGGALGGLSVLLISGVCLHVQYPYSLLAKEVNPEMLSTIRFYVGNAIYGS